MGWRDREWWREGDDDADAQGDYEGSDLQELVELQRRGMVANTSAKQDYKTANWGKRIAVNAAVTNGEVLAEVQSNVPQPWTVTVGPGDPKVAAGVSGLLADANDSYILLEYGVGGAAVKVEIDAATGWSCTVYGSFVRVTYFLPTFISLAASPPLGIAAFVCPGAQPRSQRLTRTVYYLAIGAAANAAMRIPAFAERCWLQAEGFGPTTASDARLSQERLGFTQVVAQCRLNTTQLYVLGGGWQLSPDATAMRILNLGAGTITNPRMVYSLRF